MLAEQHEDMDQLQVQFIPLSGSILSAIQQADIFDYIEMFYNPIRWDGNNNGVSPAKFEKEYLWQVISSIEN